MIDQNDLFKIIRSPLWQSEVIKVAIIEGVNNSMESEESLARHVGRGTAAARGLHRQQRDCLRRQVAAIPVRLQESTRCGYSHFSPFSRSTATEVYLVLFT